MKLDKHIKENPLLYKTFLLSLEIVRLYKYLTKEKHEYVMSKQLLKAGTSVGANCNEAVAGQSKKDFISKLSIAMKEASETRYWLSLLVFSEYLTDREVEKSLGLLHESMSLIGKSLITAKKNLESRK
ncbi:MAG: four helix bundle protein [Candidatus Cloacimonadota bacterium]|nr:four helix bundle protein [Candidatus Cloacimonadota bacterium]